jgi:hypothetical protein
VAEKTTVESSGDVESKESNGGNCESLLVVHAILEFIFCRCDNSHGGHVGYSVIGEQKIMFTD